VQKDVHLVALCNSLAQNSIMVFTRTVHDAQRCVRPPFRERAR
jgi:ATP-dependent RNA helicase DDX47/RRP3